LGGVELHENFSEGSGSRENTGADDEGIPFRFRVEFIALQHGFPDICKDLLNFQILADVFFVAHFQISFSLLYQTSESWAMGVL
jgi:hypothetical protein